MHKLSLGIGVQNSKNHFALFEQCGDVYKAMEDRVVIADILAKFERFGRLSIDLDLFELLFGIDTKRME